MAKDKRKLYRCVKKDVDGTEYLCVKFKNLKKADIREVREQINLLLKDFWEEPEYDEKAVTFEKEKKSFLKLKWPENTSQVMSKNCKCTNRDTANMFGKYLRN